MTYENKEDTKKEQSVLLRDRKRLELCGITNVIGFDESMVELSTECGGLTVEGENLHVELLNLEKGNVIVEGKVDTLSFDDHNTHKISDKSGIFSKLFH